MCHALTPCIFACVIIWFPTALAFYSPTSARSPFAVAGNWQRLFDFSADTLDSHGVATNPNLPLSSGGASSRLVTCWWSGGVRRLDSFAFRRSTITRVTAPSETREFPVCRLGLSTDVPVRLAAPSRGLTAYLSGHVLWPLSLAHAASRHVIVPCNSGAYDFLGETQQKKVGRCSCLEAST